MSAVPGAAEPAGPPQPRPPRLHRRRTVAVWLACMLGGLWLIARTPFTADLSAFLPAHPDAAQRVLIDQLQSGVVARSMLIAIEGGTAEQRADASRRLAAALRAGGQFDRVDNGEQAAPAPAASASAAATGGVEASGRWVFEHRYLLSPAVDAQRFTEAGLRDAIDEAVSVLGTPAGAAFKPLLDRDPTGETQRLAELLIPAQAPRNDAGVWASRTAPRAVLLAITRASGADLDGQAGAIAAVQQAFEPMALQALQVRMSGAGVFSVQSRAQIEREVRQLAAVGLVLITSLLLLAFGSLRALLVALLPVASGIVAGVAAVGLVFGNVHGMTLGFGSTLIGESVDYAIYYLIQARGARAALGDTGPGQRGTGWWHWRLQSWPTVRLGVLTSVCGFAALVFSGFVGLAQLGVFSIAGLVGAAAATRFLLPVLVPDGASGQGLRRRIGRIGGAVLRAMPALRRPAIGLGLAAAVVLAVQGGHPWRGDLGSLSPVPQEAQAFDAALRADLGADDARSVVVASGADPQAALVAAEAAAQRLDALVAQGLVGGYGTPSHLLPSTATQLARRAALPDADTLRTRLQQATDGGPLNAARLEPFIADVQAARQQAPVVPADLRGTALAPLLDALLFERRAAAAPGTAPGWSALLPLQPPAGGTLDPARIAAALQPGGVAAADLQVLDIQAELARLYQRYLGEALAQSLLGALAVVVLLGWSLRSARRVLAVCQPLALAVLLTLGGLAACGVALGILHLVGLLLVVAVGSNYALFFDQLRDAASVDDDTLASLLLANLTTVSSFGLIALSDIAALSALGRVVAPGALLALLLSAAFAWPARAGGASRR